MLLSVVWVALSPSGASTHEAPPGHNQSCLAFSAASRYNHAFFREHCDGSVKQEIPLKCPKNVFCGRGHPSQNVIDSKQRFCKTKGGLHAEKTKKVALIDRTSGLHVKLEAPQTKRDRFSDFF